MPAPLHTSGTCPGAASGSLCSPARCRRPRLGYRLVVCPLSLSLRFWVCLLGCAASSRCIQCSVCAHGHLWGSDGLRVESRIAQCLHLSHWPELGCTPLISAHCLPSSRNPCRVGLQHSNLWDLSPNPRGLFFQVLLTLQYVAAHQWQASMARCRRKDRRRRRPRDSQREAERPTKRVREARATAEARGDVISDSDSVSSAVGDDLASGSGGASSSGPITVFSGGRAQRIDPSESQRLQDKAAHDLLRRELPPDAFVALASRLERPYMQIEAGFKQGRPQLCSISCWFGPLRELWLAPGCKCEGGRSSAVVASGCHSGVSLCLRQRCRPGSVCGWRHRG